MASTFSFSAVAGIAEGIADGETDTTSAAISWEATVPTVMPGKWITFRGESGGDIKPSTMEVKADGTFTAQPVKLELWYYDAETMAPISLVTEGDAAPGTDAAAGVTASGVIYNVGDVEFTAGSSDVSTASASVTVDSAPAVPGAPIALNKYETEWNIESVNPINSVVPGDTIQAQTIVTAEVSFADMIPVGG